MWKFYFPTCALAKITGIIVQEIPMKLKKMPVI